MYGLIVKVKLVRGTRDQFIELLQESAVGMPGCLSYVVAGDTADDDVVWVTEVWNSLQDHETSLSLPRVQAVIPRAKAIVADFERIAATTPVWAAVGLESPSSRRRAGDLASEQAAQRDAAGEGRLETRTREQRGLSSSRGPSERHYRRDRARGPE